MAETKRVPRPRPTRNGKKNNMSPAAREKLSRLAKQRHAEGRFGGAEFGKLGGRGNTKEKRRAAQDLAVAIRSPEMVESMKAVLEDSLDSERTIKQRQDGLKLAIDIEREESKLTLQEERATAEHLDRAQLLAFLANKLTTGPAASLLRARIGDGIPDADVIEGEVVGEGDGDSDE